MFAPVKIGNSLPVENGVFAPVKIGNSLPVENGVCAPVGRVSVFHCL